MKSLSKCILGFASLLFLSGCTGQRATTTKGYSNQRRSPEWYIRLEPVTERNLDPESKSIWVMGFVKRPGPYRFKAGMTVEDALIIAGGYDHCSSCEGLLMEIGSHPSYRTPPRVLREGTRCDLRERVDWHKFPLRPEDEIEFLHVDF
jgi:hypothetical protein